jgi:hypothetical protein
MGAHPKGTRQLAPNRIVGFRYRRDVDDLAAHSAALDLADHPAGNVIFMPARIHQHTLRAGLQTVAEVVNTSSAESSDSKR